MTGTFTQAATGTLRAGRLPASRDRLAVTGAATLGGKLWFRTLGSATPAVGTTQTVLTSASVDLEGVLRLHLGRRQFGRQLGPVAHGQEPGRGAAGGGGHALLN